MTTNNKGRNGGNRATPEISDSHNHIAIKTRFKALIVGAACRGLLPTKLADWIIQCGGLAHE